MAKSACYFATGTTGGTDYTLDSINGDLLDGTSRAIVFDLVNGLLAPYYIDADSGEAESDPDIIAPDSNAGDKRWKKMDITAQTLTDLGVSAFMQTVLDDAAATNALTTLGFSTYIKTLIDDTTAAAARTTLGVYAHNSTKFTYSDTDTITLRPARYYHAGTTAQTVYWDSDITFDFGSGGSNAASDDLAANKWYAVYIDDSAVVSAATNLLTESELLNLEIDGTDYPAYSSTKHGWYNANSTSDMCIGVFKTKALAAELIEFSHTRPGEIMWDEYIAIQSSASVSTTWTSLSSLLLPSCCLRAFVSFYISGDPGSSATYYYKPLGSSATTGRIIDTRGEHNRYGHTHLWIEVGSGANHPTIQVKSSANRSDNISLNQQGYAMPIGMY